MQCIRIPGTALEVSRFSCGTASLHHLPRARARLDLLLAAVDAGFSHFDTSPLYGFGLSEEDLGRLLKQRGQELTVATKVGLYPPGRSAGGEISVWLRKAAGKLLPKLSRPIVDWSLAAARSSLDRSLHRLGRDWIDILFLHEPVPGLFDVDEWFAWLEEQRSQGRIRAWGLAGLPRPMVPWLRSGHPLADILQVRDSVVGREADVVLAAGRDLQFTYGYLSAPSGTAGEQPISEPLRTVLARNPTGSVVVSTRRIERLHQFAVAARG